MLGPSGLGIFRIAGRSTMRRRALLDRSPFVKLAQLARNAAFLLTHSVQQKLVAPRRPKDWQTRPASFVHTGDRGVRMRLDPSQYIDERIFVDGIYERRFLEFLRQRIRPGGVMLDVGANIGNHALYLRDLFSEVHCFEPSPRVAGRLEENIGLNRAANVRVHPLGLGASEAMIPFSNNENLALGKFLYGEQDGSTLLPVKTGDKWVAEAAEERRLHQNRR